MIRINTRFSLLKDKEIAYLFHLTTKAKERLKEKLTHNVRVREPMRTFATLGVNVREVLRTKDEKAFREVISCLFNYEKDVRERILTSIGWPHLAVYINKLDDNKNRVPWFWEGWYHKLAFLHLPLPSEENEEMIAYWQSVDKALRNIRTRIKPGKYLKKYYPNMPDDEIRYWANEYAMLHKQYELKWAYSEDECIRVINEGPSESCMSSGYHSSHVWYSGHIHPAAVYGRPDYKPDLDIDTAIAYIEDEVTGRIVARTVCNIKTKKCVRIYGHAQALEMLLANEGYVIAPNALNNARIRLIFTDDDKVIIPYVDAGVMSGGGHLYAYIEDGFLRLTTNSNAPINTYEGYTCEGVTRSSVGQCSCCGDYIIEYTYDYYNEPICSHCESNYYILAHTRRGIYPVHEDDAIYCESDNEYYHVDALSYYNINMCEYTEKYYLNCDLVVTSRGKIYIDYAAALDIPDPDGNNFAFMYDAKRLPDGRVVHIDTYEDYMHEFQLQLENR